jgi:hypothetical protein
VLQSENVWLAVETDVTLRCTSRFAPVIPFFLPLAWRKMNAVVFRFWQCECWVSSLFCHSNDCVLLSVLISPTPSVLMLLFS